jgi:chromosome segregation ATPase
MAIPSVMQGLIETEDGKVFELDSPKGSAWLECIGSFRFEPSSDSRPYTVRKESGIYWYGCRKVSGKVRKKYIGKSSEVTVAKLEEIAEALEIPPVPQVNKAAQEVAQKVAQKVAQDRLTALELQVANLQKAVEALQEALLGKLDAGDSFELPKVDSEVAEGLQDELSNLKAENEALKQELKELRRSLERADTLVNLRNQEIAKLNSRLAQKDEVISERDEEIQQLESQLATANKKISELEGENSEQFAEIKAQDAEIEELKSELARRSETKSEKSAVARKYLPKAAEVLNQLKGKRKKSRADLADLEAILEILEVRQQ